MLLAVLAERDLASGVGIDISADALAVARGNAGMLGWTTRRVSSRRLETNVPEQFDLVVSNPPYIRSADIDTLAPEVARYEPRIALDGGPTGSTPIAPLCRGFTIG